MGLFSKPAPPAETPEPSLVEIRKLSEQLARLEGQIDASQELIGANNELARVKRQLSDAQIEIERNLETIARERRELEHMVGLEKLRQAQELELARKQAKLEVEQQNLYRERQTFEDQVDFIKEETASTRQLVTELLNRMPTITINGDLGVKS